MHNKKLIATTLLLTATLAASLTACGNKTASQTPGTEVKTETTKSPVELDTEAATKKEEVTTEAVTEAPTEAVTEVQTEAVVEEVTEAPAEVVEQPAVEAPEPVVVETPAPAPSPSTNKNTNTNTASNNQTGKISNATSSKVTVNADGTVSSPGGTYSSIDAYNEGTGHTDPDDPQHLTKGGYLAGDTAAREADRAAMIEESMRMEGWIK